MVQKMVKCDQVSTRVVSIYSKSINVSRALGLFMPVQG